MNFYNVERDRKSPFGEIDKSLLGNQNVLRLQNASIFSEPGRCRLAWLCGAVAFLAWILRVLFNGSRPKFGVGPNRQK